MYKVLVVDDEPIIVDGIYSMLTELKDAELDVAKAYSAHEALATLRDNRYDIVMTDIRMPGMSGLELMDLIKEKWPLCCVIVLTGFTEFEYVYSAIQHTGVSYLLKTEGYDKIRQTVLACISQIEAELRSDELVGQTEKLMTQLLPLRRKEFMNELAYGAGYPSDERARILSELNIDLDPKRPLTLMVGALPFSDPTSSGLADRSRKAIEAQLVLERHLQPRGTRVFSFLNTAGALYCLIQPEDSAEQERLTSDLKARLETVQMAVREVFGGVLSFVLSTEPIGWEDIRYEFSRLNALANYARQFDDEFILSDRDLVKAHPPRGFALNDLSQLVRFQLEKLEVLSELMEQNRRDDFFDLFHAMMSGMPLRVHTHQGLLLEVIQTIALFFVSYINRWGFFAELATRVDLSSVYKVDALPTLKDAERYYTGIANEIFKIHNVSHQRQVTDAIGELKRYILVHLGDDLSLTRLAEVTHFSPKYLSRLFKQSTGSNLSDYINEAKIARAKELLLNPERKIHAIGAQIGYPSAPYFTRLFKKATGLSPQEYRSQFFMVR